MKSKSVLLLWLATAGLAFADPAPEAEKHSKRLLDAIESSDYERFRQDGETAFQKIEKKSFEAVVAQLAHRLKMGCEITYLGTLEQQGYTVTLWKLDFKEGDDALASLSIKNGKVGGFWIK